MDYCKVCGKETTFDFFVDFTNICWDCIEYDSKEDAPCEEQ